MSLPNETSTPFVILVSRDLMTISSVTGAASARGGRIEVLTDLDQVGQRATDSDCRCIVLELASGGVSPAELMAQLPAENRPAVIAFGSHVATALLEAAHAAGCDEVLSRGRFTATMNELLGRYLPPARGSS